MKQSKKHIGKTTLRRLSIALGLTTALYSVNTWAQAQDLLTHHVRTAVSNGEATYLHPMLATKILRLNIVLALRDQEGLDNLLKEINNPVSPTYHQYLTVSEFTDRFGPSQEDYNAVIRFAKAHGLKVVGGLRDGMNVQIEGSVKNIEKAFNISLRVYENHKENRSFYAPDREPTVDLPFPLWHISGLDNYSIAKPRYKHRNPAQVMSKPTTGSGPGGYFLGSDMRAAYYGVTGPLALTGAGQKVGLFEFYNGYNPIDLNNYYTTVGQTNTVPITQNSTDGTHVICSYDPNHPNDCDDSEQVLDVTQVLGMAPGLKSLAVYVGSGFSDGSSILSSMVSDNPLPTTIGCSWGWTPADPETLNPYWQRMIVQGQTFFVAAGDDSNWTKNGAAEAWPADSSYIVSVGGTDLKTTGPGGAWASETAWKDGGGGVSPDNIPIPSWQNLPGVINSNNKGSLILRNGPDVAANADYTFYVCLNQMLPCETDWGGTSFAAPMWAAYIALANQQATANKKPPLGFISNTLYSIGISSIYPIVFHDITMGTSGVYSAVLGYDLVTGWGSMNGPALINYLTAVK